MKMFKTIFLAFVLFAFSATAQDITNSLGSGGKFTVSPPEITDQVSESTINLFGSISYHFRDIHESTFDFEQTDYMIYVNVNSTGTLPSPIEHKGRLYMVFRDLSSVLTLLPKEDVSGNNILDNPSSLYAYLYSDGIKWHVYQLSSSGEAGLNPGYVVAIEKVSGEFVFKTQVQLYHGTGGELTVNLPLAADVEGVVYTVTFLEGYSGSGGTLNINTQGLEKINGSDVGKVQNVLYAFVYSDGENWWAYGNKGDAAAYSQPVILNDDATLYSDNLEQTFLANLTTDDHTYTLTLPLASENLGKKFTLKRNADGGIYSNNVINIKPSTGEQLDGIGSDSAYIMANDFELLKVESNGVIWMIVNSYNH